MSALARRAGGRFVLGPDRSRGFDFLIREPADLARLSGLFERGVRLFQLVDSGANLLAGSADSGDDRGLTDLGKAFLASLAEIAAENAGPRSIIDLAGLNPRAMADVLEGLESAADRPRAPLPVYSHGAASHAGFDGPRALSLDNLTRLRALGGVIGLSPGRPYFQTSDELRASIEVIAAVPCQGRAGYEGIAFGTDFVGIEQTVPGLDDVSKLCRWISRTFDRECGASLIDGSGRRLIDLAIGVPDVPA